MRTWMQFEARTRSLLNGLRGLMDSLDVKYEVRSCTGGYRIEALCDKEDAIMIREYIYDHA